LFPSNRPRSAAFHTGYVDGFFLSRDRDLDTDGRGDMPASQAAAPTPEATRETVEYRITTLRAASKITPDEAANWNGVRSE